MRPKYQNILETVGDTPVVRIGKLAPEGVNLFVKIEAFNPLGSVKDRLALGVIEEAERSGKLKPGQTVVDHQRQYRNRSRHGVRAKGLPSRGHDG